MKKRMAIGLMVGLITVLVIETKQKETSAQRGTTILIDISPDSVILAADSRSTYLNHGEKNSYTDTTSKIFNINNTFFIGAGVASINNKLVKAVISRAYSENISFEQNCKNINEYIADQLDIHYKNLPIQTKQMIFKQDAVKTEMNLLIVKYVNKNVYSCFLNFDVKTDNQFRQSVIMDSAIIKFNSYGLTMGGNRTYLKQVLSQEVKNGVTLPVLARLIKYQAKFDIEVDSIVRYVIIKPSGYRYGIYK